MPPPPPPPKPTKTVERTVLLTGFDGFSRIADNPSWNIVSSFVSPKDQSISFIAGDTEYKITFVAHPSAVKVAYATVDALIPELWKTGAWDYLLHVGVGLEGGYELETRAWESGYVLKDVDGKIPGMPPAQPAAGGKGQGKGKG